MRLNSPVNLALHCGGVLSATQGRFGGTRTSVLGRPVTKNQHFLNTSRVSAICITDTATGKLLCLLEHQRYVSAGYQTPGEAECLCYTAASPRVSSSRTAIARSYRAFASSWELPTAVRPVLPSSPRALIM